MDYTPQRAAVWRTAVAMHREGLVRLSEGNVSARCPDGRVAVTPSGLPYADMAPEDVVVVDAAGAVVAGQRRPTSELPMHLGLLAALPEVGAIVHTHSPFAVACAACGRPLPPVTSEALLVGGEVPVARLARPGTREMAAAVLDALRPSRASKAVLLQSHGVVALGQHLGEALQVALYVEQMAKTLALAQLVGGAPLVLTADVLAALDGEAPAPGPYRGEDLGESP
jgi:L-fuculose-phosphate aldolase